MSINSKFYIVYEQVMDILLESRRDDIEKQVNNLDIPDEEKPKLIKQLSSFNPPKKFMIALKWLKNKELDRPINEKMLDEAVRLVEKYHLNYQNFSSMEDLLKEVEDKEMRFDKEHQKLDPDQMPELSHKKNLGDGITTYWVEDSPRGMNAVRSLIDCNWGYFANAWCLTKRDADGKLDKAWENWEIYSTYPKRIAFKDGKLLAFSASNDDTLLWWDRHNEQYHRIPESKVFDKEGEKLSEDLTYNKLTKYINRDKFDDETINDIVNDNTEVKMIISNYNELGETFKDQMSIDQYKKILTKLSDDPNQMVRMNVAKNPFTPFEILKKLIKDNFVLIKYSVINNPMISKKFLIDILNDCKKDLKNDPDGIFYSKVLEKIKNYK